MSDTYCMKNDLWEVEVSSSKGRVTKLVDRADGATRVIRPSLADDYVPKAGTSCSSAWSPGSNAGISRTSTPLC